MSLQKESEWEKEFDERWKKRDYYNFDQEAIKRFIATRISQAVSNREKEIAEEVEKLDVMKNDNQYLVDINKVLSILKH